MTFFFLFFFINIDQFCFKWPRAGTLCVWSSDRDESNVYGPHADIDGDPWPIMFNNTLP